ncbi:MAG: calcium-binding protein, partial [Methylocella sp.]
MPEAIADLVTYVPNPRYQSTLDTYYRNAPVQPPDSSHVSGYQVSGQVLQGTQSTGTALGSDLHLGMWLSTFQLHSMSLLVTLMYGTDTENVANQGWKDISGPLLSQLFDERIATAAGIVQNGASEPADAMRDMIAYSVIDEGARPFGDAAIRAMFDDANEIAPLFSDSSKSLLTTDLYSDNTNERTFKTSLSGIIVQHAAQLANSQTMMAEGQDKSIAISGDGYVAISVDKDSAAWSGAASIAGFDDLKINVKDLLHASQTIVTGEAQAILDDVDFAVMARSGTVNAEDIKDSFEQGYHLSDASHAGALVIGTTEIDHITGTKGNDFLIGGGGADVLVGGDGLDAFFGGAGADVLILGNIDGNNPDTGEVPEGSPTAETIDSGSGTDYLVVTGGIVLSKDDTGDRAGDRLLMHASALGLPDSGDGKIGLFQFRGGAYLADAIPPENVFLANYNQDSNLITEGNGDGGPYRVYYCTDQEYGSSTAPTFTVEYRLFESDNRLEIYTDSTFVRIEDFQDGDYGIHLGIYFPHGQHKAGEYLTDAQVEQSFNQGEATAYNKAVYPPSSLAISLTADGEVQGAQRSALAASAGAAVITAENLVIAIDGGDNADQLQGIDVSELINGGGGNDTLDGMGGNDRIHGGAGDDRLMGGTGADLLDGGDGFDFADYSTSAGAVTIRLMQGTGIGGDAEGDTLMGIENILGSSFDDFI